MSTEVEDYVRQGLHHLTGREERTTFDVDALVREGRRRRHTRRLAATAGLTAAAVGVVSLAISLPRGSGDAIGPSSHGSPAPAVAWEVPAPVAGEVGRVEIAVGSTYASQTIEPVEDLVYVTQFACRSADPADQVVVQVRRGDTLVESSEASCDGTPFRNGGGTYPEGGLLTLSVAAPIDAQAYAVVVPDLAGRVAHEIARATVPWSGESDTARLAVDVPVKAFVSCLATDPEARLHFRVVSGPSGEGRTMVADVVRCDGSTSGDGFTYTLTGEQWATIRLSAPYGATAFAILTQGSGPG